MAVTSKTDPIREREKFYFRQRNKNRVFEKIVALFADEAEKNGVTKKQIAERLHSDPAQITRWLSAPGNLTLDSISDILLALDAEMDYEIGKFEHRAVPNFCHPLMPAKPRSSAQGSSSWNSTLSAKAIPVVFSYDNINSATTSTSGYVVLTTEGEHV